MQGVLDSGMQNYRRLKVWKRAHAFAVQVRRCTRAFPRTGYAEMKSQLIRAAESIPSNIVEGCAAASRREFARYLDISIKSTSEVEYRLQLARDNRVLSHATWVALSDELVEIRKMLFGLRRAVLAADREAQNNERSSAPPPDPTTLEATREGKLSDRQSEGWTH